MSGENHRLRVGANMLSYFGIFPKGHIRGKEIPVTSFSKRYRTHWGSARPDMDSCFTEDNVYFDNGITIRTSEGLTKGRDWIGNDDWKKASSGLCFTDYAFGEGEYYFKAKFDPNAIGCWDAIWFYSKYPYGEIDVVERVDDKLFFSIHYGDAYNRDMYNSFINLPSYECIFRVKIGKKIKIYVNGVLCFVGREHLPSEPYQMIINSGLVEGGFERSNLMTQDAFFNVSKICKV